jgi:hypothetical protein
MLCGPVITLLSTHLYLCVDVGFVCIKYIGNALSDIVTCRNILSIDNFEKIFRSQFSGTFKILLHNKFLIL